MKDDDDDDDDDDEGDVTHNSSKSSKSSNTSKLSSRSNVKKAGSGDRVKSKKVTARKELNYNPEAKLSREEFETVYGSSASETGYRRRERDKRDRRDNRSDMFQTIMKAAVPPAAAPPATGIAANTPDALWCQSLIPIMSRMDDRKVDFQDYVSEIALKAARGGWVHPDNKDRDQD